MNKPVPTLAWFLSVGEKEKNLKFYRPFNVNIIYESCIYVLPIPAYPPPAQPSPKSWIRYWHIYRLFVCVCVFQKISNFMTSNTEGGSNFWVTETLYLIGLGTIGVRYRDSYALTVRDRYTFNSAKNDLGLLFHIRRSVFSKDFYVQRWFIFTKFIITNIFTII